MPSLDLFSGIGGFAYSLRHIAQPVAYCDIDASSREHLKRLMSKKLIPPAPIFDDVQKIKETSLKKAPVLITAGFPCQDVSSMHVTGGGLRGSRSSLVIEVFRIAACYPSVKYIFLENSPNIVHRGLFELNDYMRRQGFLHRQMINSASDVGAPHSRRRWWCLAYRRTLDCALVSPSNQPFWKPGIEPCPRLLPREGDAIRRQHDRKLIRMLGSAVVPAQVMHAWNALVSGKIPTAGPINLQPLELVQKNTKIYKPTWATPVTSPPGSTDQVRTLTYRAAGNLSNQIFYDKRSGRASSATHDINVAFILHLMGYPEKYLAM